MPNRANKRLKSLYEKGKTNDETENALILLLTATIWGVAFVAQSVGMDYVSPFTFNGVRSIIWRSCADPGDPCFRSQKEGRRKGL